MDQRAQSIGIARYFLSLLVGAPVLWITWEITGKILPRARSATNSTKANQATTWLQDVIDWMPIWFLLVAGFGVIVLAVYQREVLR